MFQPWRIKVQQAEQAYRVGQLDEAQRLLQADQLTEYQPGRQLSVAVADSLVKRAEHRASLGDTSAGWHDLNSANRLAGDTESIINLRNQLVSRALTEAEKMLTAGNPEASLHRLSRLQKRNIESSDIRALAEVSRRVQNADQFCRVGEFDRAEKELASAKILRPDLSMLEDRRQVCEARFQSREHQVRSLQKALESRDWHEVVQVSNKMLQVAADDRLAQDARRQAWKVLAPHRRTLVSQVASQVVTATEKNAQPKIARQNMTNKKNNPIDINKTQRSSPKGDAVVNIKNKDKSGRRFLLWVDCVGGFFVCLDDEIVLGQPVPGGPADVPILADISSGHAVIRRSGESYTIQPVHTVLLNDKKIDSPTVLTDQSTIDLGDGVKLLFSKPHPLSTTARLDIVSRHRTQPSADAIILMSNSCVLGPTSHNHIVCNDWPADAVVFRQNDELFFRHNERYQLDGKECKGRGSLSQSSQVSCEDFSLSLEPVVA